MVAHEEQSRLSLIRHSSEGHAGRKDGDNLI